MGIVFTLPDEAKSAVEQSHNWHFQVDQFIEPDSQPLVLLKDPVVSERKVTSTMIVCGDCNGEAELPRKTFLTAKGCCDACGGQSFVLAVKYVFDIELARRIAELAISSIIS
jgi:hypothetical protein